MVEYIESEIETISSPQIAQRLGIDDSQVRKDFKLLNNAGKCRVGYLVKELKDSIEKTLGFTQAKNAFIVGSGHLGIALAKYDNFNSYGLNILALFDNNPEKIGLQINNKDIFDTAKLPNLAKEMNVDIAILTVPRQNAQQVADFLIKSNIKYIWNFTPAVLKVPPHVKVWNENIMGSFLQFACKDMMN
jgi:redox-sensing transcriptional repressor